MFDTWVSIVIFITTIIISYVNKFFFLKDGYVFDIKNFTPRIIGKREVESKWATHISMVTIILTLIWFVDMYVKFIQQQADKIQ